MSQARIALVCLLEFRYMQLILNIPGQESAARHLGPPSMAVEPSLACNAFTSGSLIVHPEALIRGRESAPSPPSRIHPWHRGQLYACIATTFTERSLVHYCMLASLESLLEAFKLELPAAYVVGVPCC